MADGHHALHAERKRSIRDRAKRLAAGRPFFMKMDVDGGAVSLGEIENDVQVTLAIAVKGRGVETADDVGALTHGRIQQIGGAAGGQDPF